MRFRQVVALAFLHLLSFCLLSTVLVTAVKGRSDDEVMSIYESWRVKHDISYTNLEEIETRTRFEIFKNNLRFVDDHNAGKHYSPYKMGLNKLSDLTHDEFRSTYTTTYTNNMYSSLRDNGSYEYDSGHGEELPESIDWRERGAVTPVKAQGSCGSCWAFATTAAVEGLNKIVTGSLVSLSEQELLDCTKDAVGCNGGTITLALERILYNHGILTEEDYPYKAVNGICNPPRKKNKRVVTIDGFVKLPDPSTETALQKVVAKQPVSVVVAVDYKALKSYDSGVFRGPCGTSFIHAMAVVGYGTDSDGFDYWILKNSWGRHWGEDGYMRMERNVGNSSSTGLCGIAARAAYPVKTSKNPPYRPHYSILHIILTVLNVSCFLYLLMSWCVYAETPEWMYF